MYSHYKSFMMDRRTKRYLCITFSLKGQHKNLSINYHMQDAAHTTISIGHVENTSRSMSQGHTQLINQPLSSLL